MTFSYLEGPAFPVDQFFLKYLFLPADQVTLFLGVHVVQLVQGVPIIEQCFQINN